MASAARALNADVDFAFAYDLLVGPLWILNDVVHIVRLPAISYL